MIASVLVGLHAKRSFAEVATNWRYPRPISWCEIVHGHWYQLSDEVGLAGVAWLIEGATEGAWDMHGIGRPGSRGLISPELTELVRAEAVALGATRVYQPLPMRATIEAAIPGLLLQADRSAPLRELWRRAGWDKADELGPYLEVE